MTRRTFSMSAGAMLIGAAHGGTQQARSREITLVLAPSNLGLRPEGDHDPGTWRAPQVLMGAGLAGALQTQDVIELRRPTYERAAQPGTRIRNGNTIRDFSLRLAEAVRGGLQRNRFPVVIGGDCSILLGGLYAARLAGGRGLVHLDGHSDFSHPGNYDTKKVLGSVAGMDLALASGRGESLLTEWPQVGKPLAADADIVQVGERNTTDPSYKNYYADILQTAITMVTVQRALEEGIDAAAHRVIARLEERKLDKVWLHVDLDVLDEAVMPAVDSPGRPGLDYAQLSALIAALCASGRIVGANFAIYDPDRDRDLRYARPLVECIAAGVRGLEQAQRS
ncbi:MAG: arginase family protein [Steroidobacteraceae bacterium]